MSERALLAEAIARALSWYAEPELSKQSYRTKAAAIVDDLYRDANSGNAIHLKRTVEELIRRREGAA